MPASAGLFPLESVESPARNSLDRILRTDVNVGAIGFWDGHQVRRSYGVSLGLVHRTRSDIQTAASGPFAAATEWAHSSSILFSAFHGGGPHVQVLCTGHRAGRATARYHRRHEMISVQGRSLQYCRYSVLTVGYCNNK